MIAAFYASGGYTTQDIGDFFGLHYSHVRKIAAAAAKARAKAEAKT